MDGIFLCLMKYIFLNDDLNGMIFLQPIFYFKYLVILNISVVVLYFKYLVILNISPVLYFKYPVILNISAASEDNATSACDLKFMKNYELSIKYCIYHSLLFYANHTYVFFILFHIEYRYDLGNV